MASFTPDAPVFQGEVLKKPRLRGKIRVPGGIPWDKRFIRLYVDRLEYGTMVSSPINSIGINYRNLHRWKSGVSSARFPSTLVD